MRTTTKHIESLIKQLNELTHNPTETNYLLTTNQGRKAMLEYWELSFN